jgi:hypothetical protein
VQDADGPERVLRTRVLAEAERLQFTRGTLEPAKNGTSLILTTSTR